MVGLGGVLERREDSHRQRPIGTDDSAVDRRPQQLALPWASPRGGGPFPNVQRRQQRASSPPNDQRLLGRSVAKTGKADLKRLEKRAGELEREVSRLVQAIRRADIPELVEELEAVRRERQSVQETLQKAQRLQDGQGSDQEAERVADGLWALGERLSNHDPAVVRDVFRQMVQRIECRWEPAPSKGRGRGLRMAYRLVGGVDYLRDPRLFTCARYAEA